jgi:aspartyl-tRNA(Asn)/glutamyl-tRNA(Gln) amidotransferase subunit C
MSLTHDDILRVAHLARIEITPEEAQLVRQQLNGIFQLIAQMQAVDTTAVQPMSHPLGGSQRLRDDEVTEVPDREANMRNAPEAAEGLFLVPKVIE